MVATLHGHAATVNCCKWFPQEQHAGVRALRNLPPPPPLPTFEHPSVACPRAFIERRTLSSFGLTCAGGRTGVLLSGAADGSIIFWSNNSSAGGGWDCVVTLQARVSRPEGAAPLFPCFTALFRRCGLSSLGRATAKLAYCDPLNTCRPMPTQSQPCSATCTHQVGSVPWRRHPVWSDSSLQPIELATNVAPICAMHCLSRGPQGTSQL